MFGQASRSIAHRCTSNNRSEQDIYQIWPLTLVFFVQRLRRVCESISSEQFGLVGCGNWSLPALTASCLSNIFLSGLQCPNILSDRVFASRRTSLGVGRSGIRRRTLLKYSEMNRVFSGSESLSESSICCIVVRSNRSGTC